MEKRLRISPVNSKLAVNVHIYVVETNPVKAVSPVVSFTINGVKVVKIAEKSFHTNTDEDMENLQNSLAL